MGDGDVQIWPSSPAVGPDGEIRGPLSVLNIKLSSPFGEAHFEAPAEAIANFLDRTYSIVRMGRKAPSSTSTPSSTACSGRPDARVPAGQASRPAGHARPRPFGGRARAGQASRAQE